MTSYKHHRKNIDQVRQGTAREMYDHRRRLRRRGGSQQPTTQVRLGDSVLPSPVRRTLGHGLSSDSDVPTANAPNESEQNFRQVVSGRSLGQTTAQLSKNWLMWRPIEWFGPCGLMVFAANNPTETDLLREKNTIP